MPAFGGEEIRRNCITRTKCNDNNSAVNGIDLGAKTEEDNSNEYFRERENGING